MIHLGRDGVLRSFNSRREVVDYKQLSPEEITDVNSRLDFDSKLQQHVTEVMQGVDGRKVTDLKELLQPGPEIMPRFDNGTQVETEELVEKKDRNNDCTSES